MPSRDASTSPATISDESRDERALALVWVFPEFAEKAIPLADGLVIGRGEDADVVIDVARVSRRHARIEREGIAYYLRDLDSKNGTYCQGERTSRCLLAPGVVLRFGGALATIVEVHPDEDVRFREVAPGFFGGVVVARALAPLGRVAPSRLPIVIEGESGSGKEVAARAIHVLSERRGRMVGINCAALPETLAESELFGAARGAFSGATQGRTGYLKEAHQGTLFLDEVLELPLGVQAKLLRALQEGEVVRLGENAPDRFDARVIVAAQSSLRAAVESGTMRGDFLARLSGFALRLPALRERCEDIVPLFLHFLAQERDGALPEIEVSLLERLMLFDWPLNVRQLQLTAQRLAIMAPDESRLRLAHLPEGLRFGETPPSKSSFPAQRGENEQDDLGRFLKALEVTRGNVRQAALVANVSRARAYRLLKQSGVDADQFRGPSAASREGANEP